ncbi:MAG: uroporphyrinogen-III synthase [Burkholderiaceae bacterium]
MTARRLVVLTRPALEYRAPPDLPAAFGSVEASWLPALNLTPFSNTKSAIGAWLSTTNGQPRLVIFVSPGAIALSRPAFPTIWPADLPVAVMGRGSATVAQAAGIMPHQLIWPDAAGGFSQDAAGLWAVLSERTVCWAGMAVLLVKGEGGRPWLADRLQNKAAKLAIVIAYRRAAAVWHEKQLQELQNWLRAALQKSLSVAWHLTSSEGSACLAKKLRHCLPADLQQTAFAADVLATHPRIAAAAHEAGFSAVRTIAPGWPALQDALDFP